MVPFLILVFLFLILPILLFVLLRCLTKKRESEEEKIVQNSFLVTDDTLSISLEIVIKKLKQEYWFGVFAACFFLVALSISFFEHGLSSLYTPFWAFFTLLTCAASYIGYKARGRLAFYNGIDVPRLILDAKGINIPLILLLPSTSSDLVKAGKTSLEIKWQDIQEWVHSYRAFYFIKLKISLNIPEKQGIVLQKKLLTKEWDFQIMRFVQRFLPNNPVLP